MKKKIISERDWALKTLGDNDFVAGVLDSEWGKIPYQIKRIQLKGGPSPHMKNTKANKRKKKA